MLKVCNLNKQIRGKPILDGISIEVPENSVAVFLGGSGAGKSTLFRVLNHLETYDSGSFELNGKALDIASVNKNHLVGMVFQHFNLFEHLTVEENITLPLTKIQGKSLADASQVATKLLQRYGLQEKAKLSVQSLSGGQKQRLAIARTLAFDPQVVCMDEPTSALDPLLTNQIAADIQEIANSGRIVLVSTHDMQLVQRLGATVFFMEAGSILSRVHLKDYYADPKSYPFLQAFMPSDA